MEGREEEGKEEKRKKENTKQLLIPSSNADKKYIEKITEGSAYVRRP